MTKKIRFFFLAQQINVLSNLASRFIWFKNLRREDGNVKVTVIPCIVSLFSKILHEKSEIIIIYNMIHAHHGFIKKMKD